MSADLLPLVARTVEKVRLGVADSVSEAEVWAVRVLGGSKGATVCEVCRTCPIEELHHIAGRTNADLAVPVCRACHSRLSERQNGWDARWVRDDNTPELREALLLRGLSDLCEERGRFSLVFHELGKRLRATYAAVARGAG